MKYIKPGIPGKYSTIVTEYSSTNTSTKIVSTVPKIEDSVVYNRASTCSTCDKYRSNTDVCGICGCGAVISQRARSPLGKCPLDKWDK